MPLRSGFFYAEGRERCIRRMLLVSWFIADTKKPPVGGFFESDAERWLHPSFCCKELLKVLCSPTKCNFNPAGDYFTQAQYTHEINRFKRNTHSIFIVSKAVDKHYMSGITFITYKLN